MGRCACVNSVYQALHLIPPVLGNDAILGPVMVLVKFCAHFEMLRGVRGLCEPNFLGELVNELIDCCKLNTIIS